MTVVLDDERTIFDHIGPWTEDDYLTLPPSPSRVELVDGDLVVSPAPSGPHQLICRRLANRLEALAPHDLTVLDGVNLRVRPGRLLIPDVLVTHEDADRDVFDAGRSVLVAEVVSPSNTGSGWMEKHRLYAAGRVPWYLLADTDDEGRLGLTLLRLDGEQYVDFAKAAMGETLLIPGFTDEIDPAELIRRRPTP